MAEFRVYLNREKDEDDRLAIFSRLRSEGAYVAGDELEHVFTYGHDEGLERVFSDFNRGSPTFVGDESYPQRSLSVGDIVTMDGVGFICAPAGFRPETADEREARLIGHAERHPLTAKWCQHSDLLCEFRCYPADGECSCGMFRHHVHGACGGVIQTG